MTHVAERGALRLVVPCTGFLRVSEFIDVSLIELVSAGRGTCDGPSASLVVTTPGASHER